MKLLLQVQVSTSDPWGTVDIADFNDAMTMQEKCAALERMAGLKDRWIVSGYFPAGSAWRCIRRMQDKMVELCVS